jgi:hypothetical protein
LNKSFRKLKRIIFHYDLKAFHREFSKNLVPSTYSVTSVTHSIMQPEECNRRLSFAVAGHSVTITDSRNSVSDEEQTPLPLAAEQLVPRMCKTF